MTKNFKETLHKRLTERNLTYEDLAREVGVSGVYISRIMQGKAVPSDDVIYRLCDALELDLGRMVISAHLEKAPDEVKPVFERLRRHDPAEFMGDVGEYDNIEPAPVGRARPVPDVGMVHAGEFMPSEDGEFPPGMADNYVYTDQKGANLFAVRVVNDSMEPEFRDGDLLIINPNLEARTGDYVIAKLLDDNEATFKKLIIHDNLIILRPLNPRYDDIVITNPAQIEIVGRVVERKTLF